jgi:hypothetical protein
LILSRLHTSNMAKGMRSKSMRKNRATLRKTYVAPIQKKALDKCLDTLETSIKERTGNSLIALRNVMNSGKAKMETEEVEEEVVEEKPDTQGLNVARRRDKIAVLKAKKRVGSKARDNKGKTMTWF